MIPAFVDQQWLREHRRAVVLADARLYLDGRSARAGYAAGHLHGAVFVDVAEGLAAHDQPGLGRHPLPDPTAFAAMLGAAGIGDDATVVAYDDAGGVIAARLVWMLRALGHDAALLDGGLSAWEGPLETTTVPVTPATFTPVPWPAERLATIDEAADPATLLLDARPRDRFDGAPDDLDPRAGHIPGARSLPCRENLAADGRLLPAAALRARLAAVGADGTPVISSCGSGVTACHTLLVLEQLGLPGGRLFPGSWSQYSRTTRPVETTAAE